MTMRVAFVKDPGRAVPWLAMVAPGLSSAIRGRTILVKPNVVNGIGWNDGATTDPQTVKAVIDWLRQAGAAKIVIGEGSLVGADTMTSFAATGYRGLAEDCGVDLIDLKRCPSVRVPLPTAVGPFRSVLVARPVLEAGALVNIAILKAHSQVCLTMAAKNLKGCLPDDEKKRFHRVGVHHGLVALNMVLKPCLNVIDARRADLIWELGGHPVDLDFMAAGCNAVELDGVVARLVGYEPRHVPYLRLLEEAGLGSLQPSLAGVEYRLLESAGPESLAGLARLTMGRVANYHEARMSERLPGSCILGERRCSGCTGAIICALEKLRGEGLKAPGVLCVGYQSRAVPPTAIGVGDCAARGMPLDRIVPGCPPTTYEIYSWLKGRLASHE